MVSAETPADQYRADIDGLRGVAVASILLYHLFPSAVPGGFIGVDVFFVISGYLISGILLRSLARGDFRFRDFYARRVRRLFPALLLVLAAGLAAGWVLLLPDEYTRQGKHTAGAAGFVANFVFWNEVGYFDPWGELKPLLHLWSLGVEEQFYLAWPLILFLAWKRGLSARPLILGLGLASFLFARYVVQRDAIAAFYGPVPRFWELMLGSALAAMPVAVGRWRNGVAWVGLLLIAVGLFALSAETRFPGDAALLPTVGAFLAIAAGAEAWPNRRLLAARAAVGLGLISYPLYLWHWPLLSFTRLLTSGGDTAAVRAGVAAASLGLAWLTYRFVETPVRFGPRRRGVVLALAMSMAVVAGVGGWVFQARGVAARLRGRVPDVVVEHSAIDYDYVSDARFGTCWVRTADRGNAFAEECLDASGPERVIVVWGDSHAARLYPGMRQVAGASARLAQFTRDACIPLFGLGPPTCEAGNVYALRVVRQLRPQVVVLFCAWHHYRFRWGPDDPETRRLDETIAAIQGAGVDEVVVVGPAPQWHASLPRVLANLSRGDATRALPERTRFGLDPRPERSDAALEARLRGRAGVRYVSTWRVFCNEEGCLARVGEDALTSWDYGHLTTAGAVYLARRLAIAPPPGS